jgi:hypothetical protein
VLCLAHAVAGTGHTAEAKPGLQYLGWSVVLSIPWVYIMRFSCNAGGVVSVRPPHLSSLPSHGCGTAQHPAAGEASTGCVAFAYICNQLCGVL